MLRYTIFDTSWGACGCVARDGRLVASYLPGRRDAVHRTIRGSWPEALEGEDLLPRLSKSLRAYYEGRPVEFEIDVDLSDFSPFQQAVLEACRRIPYGEKATYADLARATGRPGAARAVGGTMARNPMPIVIPCHRVVRSDGSLGGFSSPNGIKEKRRLLMLEQASA